MPTKVEIPVEVKVDQKGQRNLKRLQKGLKDTGDTADTTASQFKNLAGAFTAMSLGRGILGAMQAFIRPAMQMEFAMAGVQSVAGATAEKMKELRLSIEKAARETTFAPVETAEALRTVLMNTNDVNAAMGQLPEVMKIAQASYGKLVPKTAAENIAKYNEALGRTGEEAKKTAADVFAAFRGAGVPIEALDKVLPRITTAASLGFQDARDALNAFLLAMKASPSKMRVSNQLIQFFNKLSDPKGAQKLEDALGIKVLDDFSGKVRPVQDVMRDTFKLIQGGEEVDVKRRFAEALDTGAVKPFIAILARMGTQAQKGVDPFRQLNKFIDENNQLLSKEAKRAMETATGRTQTFQETLFQLGAALGDTLLPPLKDALVALTKMVGVVKSFVEIPLVGSFIKLGLIISLVGTGIFALTSHLAGMFALIVSTAKWLSVAAVGIATPLGAIIAGVVGTGIALAVYWNDVVTWIGKARQAIVKLMIWLADKPLIGRLFDKAALEKRLAAEIHIEKEKAAVAAAAKEKERKKDLDHGRQVMQRLQMGTQGFEGAVGQLSKLMGFTQEGLNFKTIERSLDILTKKEAQIRQQLRRDPENKRLQADLRQASRGREMAQRLGTGIIRSTKGGKDSALGIERIDQQRQLLEVKTALRGVGVGGPIIKSLETAGKALAQAGTPEAMAVSGLSALQRGADPTGQALPGLPKLPGVMKDVFRSAILTSARNRAEGPVQPDAIFAKESQRLRESRFSPNEVAQRSLKAQEESTSLLGRIADGVSKTVDKIGELVDTVSSDNKGKAYPGPLDRGPLDPANTGYSLSGQPVRY